MGITGLCQRLILELKAIGKSSPSADVDVDVDDDNETIKAVPPQKQQVDEVTMKALTAVFGMESNGKIKKDRAQKVVEKLGLIYQETFDLGLGDVDDVPVEEVLADQSEADRVALLQQAFKIFDEDGNGYIEVMELKRVLDCLGLMDQAWDIWQIEKKVQVVDLNLDGKVDFGEFELMMT